MVKYKIYKHTMKLVKLEKISPRKQWNPRPDNRDKVIIVDHQFNMEDDQEFKLAVKWLREKTILVHKVFSKAVKNYK